MQLNLQQLDNHLRDNLAPIYHLYGDDILLQQDARSAIINKAKQQGATDHQTIIITPDFDWDYFSNMASQQSLFNEKRIIDLRHTSGKFDKKASQLLLNYFNAPSTDNTLILTTGKLTKAQLNTKFYKTLDSQSVSIKIWPIATYQLPQWIQQRLQKLGLKADRDSVQMLAEHTEGNLVATQQAIDKLLLLYPSQMITTQQMQYVVSNHQHYSIYDLTNAALAGHAKKTLRILTTLREESVEPVLIMWNVLRELRSLLSMALQIDQGQSISQVTASAWKSQKPLLQKALNRLRSRQILSLIQQSSTIDRVIKGRQIGNFWQQCETLLLQLSGSNIHYKQAL